MHADVDTGVTPLPHDLAVDRGDGSRRVHVVDPVLGGVRARVPAVRAPRPVRRPREARVGDGIGEDRAVGVDEAGALDEAAHRPAHREPDLGSLTHHRPGPVVRRRGVEVTDQERGDPRRDDGLQVGEDRADHRHAHPPLGAERLPPGLAVEDVARSVRPRREVIVRDRGHGARRELHERVVAVRAGSVHQGEARDHVGAPVQVVPPQRVREPGEAAVGLLEPDDVGVGASRGGHDLGEVDHGPAVLDVERHDPQADGGGGPRPRHGGERRDDERGGKEPRGEAATTVSGRHARTLARAPERTVGAGSVRLVDRSS